MFESRKCWCFFSFFFVLCVAATFAANFDHKKSRSTPKKPLANGTVITSRFGDDGSPKQQCQCTDYWLCDVKNVYKESDDSSPCGGENTVCCILPYTYPVESSSDVDDSTTSSGLQTCDNGVCVDQKMCRNYGSGIIDLRFKSCPDTKLCCPHADVIKTGTSVTPSYQPITTDETIPFHYDRPEGSTETEIPKEESNCRCVPKNLCAFYGKNVLQLRVSSCNQNEICCKPEDMLKPATEPKLKNVCGYKKGDPLTSRIANTGSNDIAEFGEFPWMSLILIKKDDYLDVVCGASLIAYDWLLTAAHCIDKVDKESLIIRVGEYDTYLASGLEPGPHQDGYVAEIIIHKNYRSDVAFNDLALIRVKEPFKFHENVVPICTPLSGPEFAKADIYDPSRCLATGWGKNAYKKDAEYSKILKKVDLLIVPRDQCQHALRKTKLGPTFILHESFICAGGEPGKDTCKGDGGGPLICALKNDPTRYVQVGVTSWGIDCAKNYPGVYASVLYNKEWLQTEPNLSAVFE